MVNIFRQLPVKNLLQQVQRDFAFAKYLTYQHKEIALGRYHQLYQLIVDKNMIDWLPDLTIEILLAYQQLTTSWQPSSYFISD